MRSFVVCTFFYLFSAGSLYAEQTSMAELSKNLPEEKVQTINGRWMIKVRVPIEGTASTSRKIAQSNAESMSKGKILEHACSAQRDGRLGKLVGIITELATNRINIDGDVLEVIMSAPVQKPKCTFESSDSKKNISEISPEKLSETVRQESPRSTNQVSQSTESSKPITITRETGSDY